MSTQRDAEEADVERERLELAGSLVAELRELVAIYERCGLDPALAQKDAQR